MWDLENSVVFVEAEVATGVVIADVFDHFPDECEVGR
jgi:hypothetical protein